MDKRPVLAPLDLRVAGGYTRRYHGLRMIMEDTVGHHSYNVCQILRFIAADEPDADLGKMLQAALDHDVAECITGDMPAPTKRLIPGLQEAFGAYEDQVMLEHGITPIELSPLERRLLKMADAMDGMRFCLQEMQMGNRKAYAIFTTFKKYVHDLDAPFTSRAYLLFASFIAEEKELAS